MSNARTRRLDGTLQIPGSSSKPKLENHPRDVLIRRQRYGEGSGPRLTRSHGGKRIAYDTVLEWRASVLDDSVARQDTKGLPAFDSVDRKIRAIRREHGRAIELLGQGDERGIRKVHRQIGIFVEQLPDTLQ
jgi:hypothetical protein